MKIIIGVVIGMVAILGLGRLGAADVMPRTSAQPQGVTQSAPLAQATTGDMNITLSERYLNQQLRVGVPAGGQISNAALDIHPGQVADLSANVQVNSFLNLPVTVNTLFTLANGRVTITVQSVKIGGFGVPNSLVEDQIATLKTNGEAEINRQLAYMEANAGLTMTGLSSTEDSLTLSFTLK